MKSNSLRPSARWLAVAALAAGAAVAQAATGFAVTPQQEKLIVPGLSTDQVTASIGRPARIARYRTEHGPTWTYNVIGAAAVSGGEDRVFDVDFDADGKVVAFGERVVVASGGE